MMIDVDEEIWLRLWRLFDAAKKMAGASPPSEQDWQVFYEVVADVPESQKPQ